ncbi:hypothetical protein CAPTEDRAFT_215833 [Capitella teleta]|uniref:Uncharacterized protein n=1 Tax=Capitella teleta TaxID=283909 RepID=R7UL88_CAPTE|nr:hypothetical protein CAPTEDRAFT_215833 [Capitella teleta]|eukprot:ELU06868.1 hypothetical protein CAPTEDRAFT_215833 [Capitella teleta]
MVSVVQIQDFDELIKGYNGGINNVLVIYAPLKSITLKPCNPKKWHDAEIHEARRERRKRELKYKNTELQVHKEMFEEQAKEVVQLIKGEKKKHFFHRNLLMQLQKETFKLPTELMIPMNRGRENEDNPKRVDEFSHFFKTKTRIFRIQDPDICASLTKI